jgi:hypothetical protein
MNIQELIDEIVGEVSYRTGNGLVDFQNGEHLYILSEVLTEMGLGGVKDELIQTLMEADGEKKFKNPILNKVVKYKSEEGEEREGIVGNLLRLDPKQPGRVAAEKLVPADGTPERKAMEDELGGEGQPGRDIEGEREKGGDEGGEMEQPELGTALKSDTKGGKEYNDSLPDGDPAKDNKTVYPLGGGYYSDTKGGEPKYKKVEEVLIETETVVDTPKQDDVKVQVISDKDVKKAKEEITTQLKQKFSKKSEIAENLVIDGGRTLENGTRVRDILDEKGKPIPVDTTDGRKKAAEAIRKKLTGFESKIKEAIDNFGETIEVKKWLGEIGEMSALMQILEQDVEAYLLTDSERKNDIVFVKKDGDETTLSTGYLSVKTTMKGKQVNKLGANCKADLDKLSQSGNSSFESTVGGKSYNLKPTNVLGSVVDIKSAFFAKFSLKDGVERTAKGKLTRINPEKHADVKEDDIIEIKGIKYFKDQSSYLKNTPITDADINELFDKNVDKFLTNLSKPKKGETNQIGDEEDLKQTKEYLREIFLEDYNRSLSEGKSYTLNDMHETMHYVIGKTMHEADIPIEATTDTMAIEFESKKTEPSIGIIKKDDANKDIFQQLEKNKSIKDERQRFIDLSKSCLNIRSRTRAVGNPLRYDGIDNSSPIAKKPTETRTSIQDYVKS